MRILQGYAGRAFHVDGGYPSAPATVTVWFIEAPGQSPTWSHYLLSVVHLREVVGVPAAVVNVPGATHEVMLFALDPGQNPEPGRAESWSPLFPLNVVLQLELPNDAAAAELCGLAAQAVVDGLLWAEPPMSGQREPWRSSLLKTAAHLRGEAHAHHGVIVPEVGR